MKQSLYKTISYRAIMFFATGLAVYGFSGDIKLSFSVSVLEIILKTFVYYSHERLWEWRKKNVL